MHFIVLVIGENVEAQLVPYQENNMGDCPEEYLEWCDDEGEYHDTEAEAIKASKDPTQVYQANPNAKWDWYQIGGRWHGFFKVKKGVRPLYTKFGDPSWWHKDEGNINPKGRADILKKKYWDMEAQAKEEMGIFPYAILQEGVWREKPYFGASTTKAEKLLKKQWEKEVMEIYDSLDDNTLLTAVDCHI